MSDYKSSTYWRNYQKALQKEKKSKKVLFLSIVLFFVTFAAFFIYLEFFPSTEKIQDSKTDALIPKQEIRNVIKSKTDSELTRKYFTIQYNGEFLTLQTTIDQNLQAYLENEINSALHKGKGAPEVISFVVIEPETGKIIGMKGYNSNPDKNKNPCTKNLIPAASVFKIVTASAVVETKGYSPDKKLWFNGGKYTLYKRQLTQKKNKYTNYVRLKDAFAQSINPVFGKIGFSELKKETLARYCDKFFFNKKLDADLLIAPSSIKIENAKYNRAEIACGFNNTTRISVVHAAMINAAIANKGKTPYPYLIQKVMDDKRIIRYETKDNDPIFTIIKEPTAAAVAVMMERTIKRGTAKGSFNTYRRGISMKDLIIGGKTGSIFNRSHTIKYDWFTGFAKNKTTGKKIAFAIVVGHGEYLGVKAATYGRRMISNYFSNLS